MNQMELVECLREKTGCSYSEAKAALEATGSDLLEALCWLEQHNKTQLMGASCSTQDREPPKPEPEPAPKQPKPEGKADNTSKPDGEAKPKSNNNHHRRRRRPRGPKPEGGAPKAE